MKLGLYVLLAVLALAIIGCAAKSDVIVKQEANTSAPVDTAGDASAMQVENSFDTGLQTDTTANASDDINPDDLVY